MSLPQTSWRPPRPQEPVRVSLIAEFSREPKLHRGRAQDREATETHDSRPAFPVPSVPGQPRRGSRPGLPHPPPPTPRAPQKSPQPPLPAGARPTRSVEGFPRGPRPPGGAAQGRRPHTHHRPSSDHHDPSARSPYLALRLGLLQLLAAAAAARGS